MKLTQDAIDEIKAIEMRSGKLTPEQVVEAAGDELSALHKCFTWDDGEAAAKWRLEEAREIIRSVRIEVVYEERKIRSVAYVRDVRRKTDEAGYVNILKVRRDDVRETMRCELAAISALLSRAIGIAQSRTELSKFYGKLVGIKAQVDRLADGN